VHVGHSAHQLFENVLTSFSWQALIRLFLDVMEDRTSRAHFHYQVDLGALVDYFVQLHDIGMPEVGESINLAMDCQLGLFVQQIFLFIRLDCNHVLCFFVCGTSNDRKSTCADLQRNLELAELQRLLFRILLASSID